MPSTLRTYAFSPALLAAYGGNVDAVLVDLETDSGVFAIGADLVRLTIGRHAVDGVPLISHSYDLAVVE